MVHWHHTFIYGIVVIVVLSWSRTFAQGAGLSETAEAYQWTDPDPIPIELENLMPGYPSAVARNDTIFLAFQANAMHESDIYLPKDVYVMQYYNGNWTTPVNISRSTVSSAFPRLALADPGSANILYLIWGEQTTPELQLDGPPRPIIPDEIFYATYNKGVWSEPYSLFRTNSRAIHFTRRLVSNGQNILHFTFLAPDPVNRKPSIFYVRNEGDAWSAPKTIATGYEPELTRLGNGRLLLAYIRADTIWARRERSRDMNSVFIKESRDGGRTWSKDLLIQRSGFKPAYSPRFTIDGKGRAHLFWRQDSNGDRRPNTIMHTYSTDGSTWTAPREIIDTEKLTTGYPTYFEMTGTPDGNIHAVITWGKGPGSSTNQLFYTRWDGNRWEKLYPLFNFQLSGPPRLLYDEAGNRLHLLFRAGTKEEQRLYHAVGGELSE